MEIHNPEQNGPLLVYSSDSGSLPQKTDRFSIPRVLTPVRDSDLIITGSIGKIAFTGRL